MNLALRKGNPLNDDILEESGKPLYRVDSPFKFFGQRNSTLIRLSGGEHIVGHIQRPYWTKPVVTMRGRRIHISSGGWTKKKDTFQASDGHSYQWKISGGHPILVRVHGGHKAPIAAYSPKSSVFSFRHHHAVLNIAPEAMHLLDEIVLTFLYVEQKRRHRKRAAGAAAAAAASA